MLITKGKQDTGYMELQCISHSFCKYKTVIKNKVYIKPDTKV